MENSLPLSDCRVKKTELATKWKPVTRKAYPERLPGDEKLPSIDVFVYLSDDGGSVVTFQALKQAWKFSKLWVPFCRKYRVKIGCPEAYFLTDETGPVATFHSSEFIAEKKEIEKRYMEFKESVTKNLADTSIPVSRDHPPIIEVMNDGNGDGMDSDKRKIPLVYIAREKRPSHPHHFKAGALNVLLRVSAMISNSPYILILDCDMYCNDPLSARQAMCFHLNPELSAKLSFVQFPQRFYNINEIDINDGKQRYVWVGFRYISVVEDYFTGFIMHCKGWISVYFDPSKPGFFGEIPISLGEILVQQTRWSVGFYQVTLSSPHSSTLPNTRHFSVPRGFKSIFIVFLFIFLSAQLKHVQEVFLTGHSIRTWSNEQRMWMMKALTSYLFAGLEVAMEKIGLTKTSFLPTNKVDDDQQTKCYQMGIYNFQAPARFMVPLCSLYMLNVGSLIIGFGRIMQSQKWGEMLLQALIPLFATVLHFLCLKECC
ncbi:Cellulose synthase-like protein E6 [Sesamum angolense]|uniref:Cellulose synthase-like protein E6 n=1 Tax=Sesamum angolense TaxID=2727404 RepID=A0AAE1W139_9LAMI|nr:Cellulose synthase-like protein E6 [Sesamum angolense]